MMDFSNASDAAITNEAGLYHLPEKTVPGLLCILPEGAIPMVSAIAPQGGMLRGALVEATLKRFACACGRTGARRPGKGAGSKTLPALLPGRLASRTFGARRGR